MNKTRGVVHLGGVVDGEEHYVAEGEEGRGEQAVQVFRLSEHGVLFEEGNGLRQTHAEPAALHDELVAFGSMEASGVDAPDSRVLKPGPPV